MTLDEIKKFFLLENDPQLFETAISPRSCGGGAKFEQLAMYGDLVIDMHLLDYLISEDFQLNGDITNHRNTIHNGNIITAFADYLGIPNILTPPNSTYHPQKRELAEIVEALIGAAFKANGLERCAPIILTFAKFAQKIQKTSQKQGEFDPSKNYKGKLLELFQKKHLDLPDLEANRIGGADNSANYQFENDIIFDGIKHEILSHHWSTKILAEQEAAYIALLLISDNNAEYIMFDPTRENMPASQEETMYPTTSIDDEELIFRKPAPQGKPVPQDKLMEMSQNTGELLVDYVNRKVTSTKVFRVFKLLSDRLQDVSEASWLCKLISGDSDDSEVLALINLQLGNDMYFALGFGQSNSQAREAAGKDMLTKVDLIEWLENHHPNHTI